MLFIIYALDNLNNQQTTSIICVPISTFSEKLILKTRSVFQQTIMQVYKTPTIDYQLYLIQITEQITGRFSFPN